MKKRKIKRLLVMVIAAVFVLASTVIALNQQWKILPIPTWDELFVMAGLREDIKIPDSQFRMTVLNVGNADCVLLQNGDRYALVDAGENDDGKDIVTFLQRVGIKRLEYVIATHPDADHIGGMDDVIENIEIGTFLMSFMPEGYTPTTRVYEKMLTALIEKDITPIDPSYGDSFEFGDAYIDILSGLSEHKDTNEQSIVCRIRFGQTRFLLTGDAGKEVEEELLSAGADLRADVLKVGHHGSRSSSTKEFIAAVSPSVAVITCGEGNSYNHPHKETLNTLKKANCTIYRCDLHGEIAVTSDGKTVSVATEM